MEHFMLDAISIPHELLLLPQLQTTLSRRLSHIGWRFGFNMRSNIYGIEFYKNICKIKSNDIVIFFMVENKEPVLNIVSWLPKKTRKIVWFWNSVNDGFNKSAESHSMYLDIKMMKWAGCDIATFDPYDAEIFNLKLVNQFFNFSKVPGPKANPQYDFYFIGNPRGSQREHILAEIKERIEQQKLSINILMRNLTMSGYISYEENLANVSNCRCVIEIVRENQTGLSLRPLEALAMNKKLVTNNKNIKNMDIYSPNNIFIWGVDDSSRLASFIKEPLDPLPNDVLHQYDVNCWLDKLLKCS